MNVAVICEFSGIVRDAFIARGHDAVSFDLLPTEKPGPHVQGDIMQLPLDYWKQFDLAICHPPCTYLSNAGAKHLWKGHLLNQERYLKGLDAKRFFVYLMALPIEKICIENPIPSKVYEMPPYDQIIQPFYFGHEAQKKTCLWLKSLPPLFPSSMVTPKVNCHDAGTWFMKGGTDRQKNRARTFQGIADAMAEQWGDIQVSKYHNIRTAIDGITFASKAEANRYCELKLLKRAGEIKDFTLQPKFQLTGGIKYIGDFLVTGNDGFQWVEDVKGYITKEFRIKQKLFAHDYPDMELRVIK
jgi:hypothetical protein